ncbi:endonuclease III [Candidatus Woesearchaeota archaeon]|nr:endonuclease III [Candidatus Woesearchaeota archaeon]
MAKNIPLVLKKLTEYHGTTMLGEFSSRYNKWQVLVSTILSARARDEVTMPLCKELFSKYPTMQKLAKANIKDVEKLIKRIGFYRNKAKNIVQASRMILEKFKGKVPSKREELMKLPGVGSKVAGCVRVYAFNEPSIPVDTHVHRIVNRLGWVKTKTPDQTEQQLEKIVPKRYWKLVNELLVYHGKTICLSQIPRCSECVVEKYCKKVGVKKQK